jgi:dolichol-phosphate mannosyltransferase
VTRQKGWRPPAAIHIAAVIPAYNLAGHLGEVLRSLPPLFTSIFVIDDASTDDTLAILQHYAQLDPRILVLRHESNRGVGGAMVTGFSAALDAGADILVKIDGDGQMPLWLVSDLIAPLLSGTADYTKGNRFRDFAAIRSMPVTRKFGNVALSFLAKAATGYWRCFDPTNGFVAVRADVLSQIPLSKIDPSYFFETSMLSHLYLIDAVVKDVPMPAQYAGEPSSLSILRVLGQFPIRLLTSLVRRLVLKNYLYDFNLESVHLLVGSLLVLSGVAYGGYNWLWYTGHHTGAPTGTVVLPAMTIILGVQLLLSAINLDLQASPVTPINGGPLTPEEPSRRQGESSRSGDEAVVQ